MQGKSIRLPAGLLEVVAYGDVVLFRAWCPRCDQTSFVDQGMTQCCRAIVEATRIRQTREATAIARRYSLSDTARAAKLTEQAGLCFYCLRMLYSEVYRGEKPVWLRPEADHFLPYSYLQTHDARAVVIACHICNQFKSNMVFLTVDAARDYLALRWRRKGYSDIPPELR